MILISNFFKNFKEKKLKIYLKCLEFIFLCLYKVFSTIIYVIYFKFTTSNVISSVLLSLKTKKEI